jgi:hypothetical protein
MLWGIRKVPAYVESRLTPVTYSKLIVEFPDGEFLFEAVVLIDHFVRYMPSITPFLCDLFLSALVEATRHTRTDIRQSALATVSLFWIGGYCELGRDDIQHFASLHVGHLMNGEAQDKVGAVEFFVHMTQAYPEMLKDVVPIDVQMEIITCLLEDWDESDSTSE